MKNLKGGETMGRRTWVFLAILIVFSFLISGCYYFAAQKEMKNASSLLSELKAMNGAKLVPYEYCSAEKFLEMSQGEANENDFKHSKDFAVRSKSAAEAGISKVKNMKK
jgi:hypothetical protein